MGKNKYFSTKSVFGQLISLIDDSMIQKAVKKHDSDRYVKHFKCKDHLFSMVFCCLEKCNSLREVAGGMLGLSGKEEAVRISHLPKKSTLSDEIIEVEVDKGSAKSKLKLRKIKYYDRENKRTFEFISNQAVSLRSFPLFRSAAPVGQPYSFIITLLVNKLFIISI
ncbi:DUF4372 domain-containing protein [Flavobacterium sp. LS1P28]|uniref:DUF4372 domain-containing protein n=1 Tax=Flavobacterium sp. LS1P28 TaxID=2497752 RepID=UPI001F3D6149|nr:DUF4372 domain-containing protein [Flavobacterium sp. LS1P28]